MFAPATETVAPAPGAATEEEKKVEGEEGEVKKEDGESTTTEGGPGDGGEKDEIATVTIEKERPGSTLSRIEEEPEVEATPG